MSDRISVGGLEADFVLDTGSVAGDLAKVQGAMDKVGSEIKKLQQDFQAGTISFAEFDSQTDHLVATQENLKRKAAELSTALQAEAAAAQAAARAAGAHAGASDAAAQAAARSGAAVRKSTAEAEAGANRMGRGMMQLGYIADDIRYGFGAVVNNIGPLVMAFSGNAGLAGAAQMAAIAGYQLYQKWDDVREALGDTSGADDAKRSIESMTEAVKALRKEAEGSFFDSLANAMGFHPNAGKLSAAGMMEQGLNARKEAEANAKKLEGEKTDEQEQAAKRFKAAVQDAGGFQAIVADVTEKEFKARGPAAFLSTRNSKGGLGESEAAEFKRLQREAMTVDDHANLDRLEKLHESGAMLSLEDTGKLGGLRMKRANWTDADQTRMAELKEKARQAAEQEARERVGGAMHSADAQKALGDLVGGPRGDVLAGRAQTSAEKAAEEDGKSDAFDRGFAERAKAVKERDRKRQQKDREFKRQQAEDARLDEAARDQNLELADKLLPGVKGQVEKNVLAAKVNGVPMSKVKDMLTSALMNPDGEGPGSGMNEQDAKQTARMLVAEGNDSVNKKIAGREQRQDGLQRAAKSEIYGASDLTQKIQSSIGTGGDEGKKQTNLQERMLDYLAKLSGRQGLIIGVEN